MASDGPKSGGSGTGGAGKIGGAAGVTGSAKNSITPGFLGGAGGGEKPAGLSGGAGVLGAAENFAINADLGQKSDDLDGALEGEEDVNDVNYSGSGKESGSGEETQGFISGHKGPIATLIGIFITLAGLIGGAQLSQPFSLAAQLKTTFNSMQTSVANRSNVFFRYQLGKEVKNPLHSKLFSGKYFKISSKQEAKLKSRGIELENVDVNGKIKTIMKYTDGSGNIKYIVPDTGDIGSVQSIKSGSVVMDFNDAFKTDAGFFEAYKGGSLLWRGAITNWFQSLTRKFLADNRLTRNLFDNFKQSVDENGKYKGGAELIAKGTNEVTTHGARVTGDNQSDLKDADGNIKTDYSVDSEGKVTAKGVNIKGNTVDVSGETLVRSNGFADAQAKLEAIAKKIKPDSGGGISGMVQTGTSIICGVGDVIGVISLAITGAEALQMIHLITGYLEAIDKVKAGDGDESPINELADGLNNRGTNVHYDYNINYNVNSLEGVNGDAAAEEGSWRTLEANANNMANAGLTSSSTSKTAMESSGIASLYGGGKVNPNDASVKSLNFSGNIKRIVGGLGVSMAAFNTCAVAKVGANLWGVVEDGLEYIPCIIGLIGSIFTYGATSTLCAGAVMNIVSKVALSAVITAAVGAVISAIVPFAARMFTRDLITNLAGEDLGNAIVSGANMYMGNNHRYNGGSLSDRNNYVQFALAQQEVIAENARYERMTKSPFDASSEYTFMGVLMRTLMNYTGSSSVISIVNSTNNIIGSSIAAILPTASAIDANEMIYDEETYKEVCPYLASVGAVGDAYCNPYAVTDMSTIGMDPSEVMYEIKDDLIYETVDENDNTVDDGVNCESDSCDAGETGVRIKGDSQLAKYILFCDQRASAFGIADQNIANKLASWLDVRTDVSAVDTVANGAIGAVPMLGDLADVVQNSQKLANLGYITGQSCVAGNNGPDEGNPMNTGTIDSKAIDNINKDNENTEGSKLTKNISVATPSWNKAKLYQRFIEDQSLMESMGLIEESAVTAFLREYEKENPVDTSYAGLLARYSGLERDDVISLMELIDYYNYIANYDPTERYAFGQEVKPAGAQELRFDNDQKVAYVVLLNTIEFADVRNRSFVV